MQNPVIVVPGITATDLVDDYPLKADEIWTMVFNREYERLALHPDDLRYEAVEPAHVVSGQVFPIYNDLISALRHELSRRADRPTPVFAFPYDWRVDIRQTAARLADFVDEVIARTGLLGHYARADQIRVDLVGHSMGGLVITEYLAGGGRSAPVGKVATIGTPYLGSIEAIVKIATGMSLITGPDPKEREREAARVTPALYQLFPSYEGAVVDSAGNDLDIFDCDNIQPSIIDSLEEFVRMFSVRTPRNRRRTRAIEILDEMLDNAARHRETVTSFKPSAAGLTRSDWLAIIGIGEVTRACLEIGNGPRFDIDGARFVDDRQGNRSRRTGDGTVPLAGALPPFLPPGHVVCMTSDDLEFLEFRDRMLASIGGFHGLMPSINAVQRLVIKHFCPPYRGKLAGRPVPGVRKWNPPVAELVTN